MYCMNYDQNMFILSMNETSFNLDQRKHVRNGQHICEEEANAQKIQNWAHYETKFLAIGVMKRYKT